MKVDDIGLKDPCCESWEKMSGDEKRRHCQVCDKDVVNLSALTAAQAHALLETSSPCVRFRHDGHGNVVFLHPQVRRQRRGLKHLVAAAVLVAPFLVGAGVMVSVDDILESDASAGRAAEESKALSEHEEWMLRVVGDGENAGSTAVTMGEPAH